MVQTPASGAFVVDAIAQALRIAEVFATNERRLDNKVSEDCRLWIELLRQSQGQLFQDMAPTILRGDLGAPAGVELTQRRWLQFQRWFDRHMAGSLHRASAQSGIPALYGGRVSDRRGGRAEYSEARYFVSFESHDAEALKMVSAVRPPTYGASGDGLFASLDGSLGVGHSRSAQHDGRYRSPVRSEATVAASEARLRAQISHLENVSSRLKRLLAERDLEIDDLRGRMPPV